MLSLCSFNKKEAVIDRLYGIIVMASSARRFLFKRKSAMAGFLPQLFIVHSSLFIYLMRLLFYKI